MAWIEVGRPTPAMISVAVLPLRFPRAKNFQASSFPDELSTGAGLLTSLSTTARPGLVPSRSYAASLITLRIPSSTVQDDYVWRFGKSEWNNRAIGSPK